MIPLLRKLFFIVKTEPRSLRTVSNGDGLPGRHGTGSANVFADLLYFSLRTLNQAGWASGKCWGIGSLLGRLKIAAWGQFPIDIRIFELEIGLRCYVAG